ncbi:hypothetical protein PT974_09678 [Cladobotryum mycophilum]|uniref:Uncharacterized protein n=1 Tax=Cladobotryum mycophilum TaxID=491253 RepID=A0ABR0SHS0_9HYPO
MGRSYFIPLEFPLLPVGVSYDYHEDGFWDFHERAGWILDGRRDHHKFTTELTDALNPVLVKLDNKSYRCRKRFIPRTLIEKRSNDALK